MIYAREHAASWECVVLLLLRSRSKVHVSCSSVQLLKFILKMIKRNGSFRLNFESHKLVLAMRRIFILSFLLAPSYLESIPYHIPN